MYTSDSSGLYINPSRLLLPISSKKNVTVAGSERPRMAHHGYIKGFKSTRIDEVHLAPTTLLSRCAQHCHLVVGAENRDYLKNMDQGKYKGCLSINKPEILPHKRTVPLIFTRTLLAIKRRVSKAQSKMTKKACESDDMKISLS